MNRVQTTLLAPVGILALLNTLGCDGIIEIKDPCSLIEEICNGVDDNCNGMVDEGFPHTAHYPDGDGDGFGNRLMQEASCMDVNVRPGFVDNGDDCNDMDPSAHPGGLDDNCDGIDNNCSGTPDDEADSGLFEDWYLDEDGDGSGDPLTFIPTCAGNPTANMLLNPGGRQYVGNAWDCNPYEADFNDANPDSSIDCQDPDDDGITSRGDSNPLTFVANGGQSINELVNIMEPAYRAMLEAARWQIPEMYEPLGTSLGACWDWNTRGDYGTFLCQDNSVMDIVYGPVPMEGLGLPYVYDIDFDLRTQQGSEAVVVILSDPCDAENTCGSEMPLLLISPVAGEIWLAEYSSASGFNLLDSADLSAYDWDGDGTIDPYADNVWYDFHVESNTAGHLSVMVGIDGSEIVYEVVNTLNASTTTVGGNVAFITANSSVEVNDLDVFALNGLHREDASGQ